MNILVLSYYFYPDLCAGSFRCTSFIDQLVKQYGHLGQIDILTTVPNRYADYAIKASEYEAHPGITIRRITLPAHRSKFLDQSRGFLHYAREVLCLTKAKQYDLVFATSSRLMTASLGAYIAKQQQAKLYLDIRDIFVDTLQDVFPKSVTLLTKPVFSRLEKWTCRRADRINLVSKGFQDYFQLRYPDKQYDWHTNGIDAEFLSETEVQPDRELSKPYTVLYAGNIGEGQGLHTIIPELARKLEGEIVFRILGAGGRLNILREVVAKLDNVTILPPVSRAQLLAEYRQADILFIHLNDYPAFQKVLPSKIFEYGAMGKPIWAGIDGYSAHFVGQEIKNASVFKPCDADDGVAAFSRLNLQSVQRTDFIEKYSRHRIMQSMAQDVMQLLLQ
ncbi:MAG: glycosyltransferase family 4 protein [Legionellaceae bacterium]|nr:glycosyltransferase family 4 protein [Legionellaceae bacterium]